MAVKKIIGDATLYTGDAISVLKSLPDESVQTCITSPPYFGLRDYGTGQWEGGDPDCDHTGSVKLSQENPKSWKQNTNKGSLGVRLGNCACGAIRIDDQIGLEPTLQEYIDKLVDVFRQVRRVLRDDGTLWLNLGDSYASSSNTGGTNSLQGASSRVAAMNDHKRQIPIGLKPKDLIGVPWRVALALQADGWYLRQDIIWHKPNPMPEPVQDRCTKAHEYIFLLSKSRKYYFDVEAIQERSINAGRIQVTTEKGFARSAAGLGIKPTGNAIPGTLVEIKENRNKRSVWTVTNHSYKEAHFATYPPELITPCVMAGCPPGGVVLDTFSGSGTTGFVALQQGRHYVGIELNPEYQDLAVERITPAAVQPRLFT
jgi:DNA modification methylase